MFYSSFVGGEAVLAETSRFLPKGKQKGIRPLAYAFSWPPSYSDFAARHRLGIRNTEIDVMVTADGVPMVLHGDTTVNRIVSVHCSSPVSVAWNTSAEIEAACRRPTLMAVLQGLSWEHVLIDLKRINGNTIAVTDCVGHLSRVIDVVEEARLISRTTFIMYAIDDALESLAKSRGIVYGTKAGAGRGYRVRAAWSPMKAPRPAPDAVLISGFPGYSIDESRARKAEGHH